MSEGLTLCLMILTFAAVLIIAAIASVLVADYNDFFENGEMVLFIIFIVIFGALSIWLWVDVLFPLSVLSGGS